MSMSQEQQRAAAERILKKHPLTPEETARFKMLTKTPEEYDVPGKERVCGNCGAMFEDETDSKGNVKVTALEKFSDHQTEHNATGAQWTEAYNRIQASKQRASI